MLLLFTPRVLDHITPAGHPESPERGEVMRAAALRAADLGITVRDPRAATDEEILRIHDADFLAAIQATRGRAVALDADTFTSPDSHDVARLAAGAACDALVERARRAVGELLNADPRGVAFGPNMTTLTFGLSRAMAETLRPAGTRLVIARATASVLATLRVNGVLSAVGDEDVFPTVAAAVAAHEQRSGAGTATS